VSDHEPRETIERDRDASWRQADLVPEGTTRIGLVVRAYSDRGRAMIDERALILESVESMADNVVASRAAAIDATTAFPHDIYKAFADLGLFAAFVPAEYGGIEIGLETTMLAVERIAEASAACALLVGNCGDGVGAIIHGGSPEQQARTLPAVADGTLVPCFCLTEPGAGSDAAALATTARPDGGRFRISGTKLYVTNGSVGGVFTLWARTDAGISAFLVEGQAEGLEVVRDEDLVGLRGLPATHLRFNETPAELLGRDGDGFRLAMVTLDEARLNIAGCALGTARGALLVALDHARVRETFGQPIIRHQGLAFLLADVVTEVAAARALWLQALREVERGLGRRASTTCAMAKNACCAAAMRATTESVQVLGGAGLTRDLPVERMFRDAKTFQILDGTTQIQQLIIARHLEQTGLPL
jgi:alkylation response protein AidB-like acyl-CoA dehydrogenase